MVKSVSPSGNSHFTTNNKLSTISKEIKTQKNLNSNVSSFTSVKPVTTSSTTKTIGVTSAVKTVASSTSTNTTHSSPVTSFSRVVTTHTVTSGGITLTKPITILYASPSKNIAQQNGLVTSSMKPLNNCIGKLTNNSDTKPIAKVEGTVKKSATDQQQALTKTTLPNIFLKTTSVQSTNSKNSKTNILHSSKTKSIGVNNISEKQTCQTEVKTLTNDSKLRTIGESTKAVSVSPPGTNTPRNVSVVGTVTSGTNAGGGSTKVIVLTNTGSGNIIKNIATSSTNVQRTVSGGGVHGNTITSSTVSSPGMQRIVVHSSPQKSMLNGNVGGGTSNLPPTTQASSPVSAICAVSGLDSIQGTLFTLCLSIHCRIKTDVNTTYLEFSTMSFSPTTA